MIFDGCTTEWPRRRLSHDTLAGWLEEMEPGLLDMVILFETGEDYRERDLVDKAIRLIEIFGLEGAGLIVGCP
jgi:hypothetical protein